jgi:hypothetical protein
MVTNKTWTPLVKHYLRLSAYLPRSHDRTNSHIKAAFLLTPVKEDVRLLFVTVTRGDLANLWLYVQPPRGEVWFRLLQYIGSRAPLWRFFSGDFFDEIAVFIYRQIRRRMLRPSRSVPTTLMFIPI